MKKLCIFDLDGTLSDTLPTIAYYGNKALEKFAHPPIEQERYKKLVGDGRDELIHRMLACSNSDTPEEFARVGAAYDAAYEADTLYLTKPYDGIDELLKKLRASGIRLAVMSNKPHNVVCDVVKKLFGDCFDVVYGKKDEFEAKPNPRAALEICRIMQVAPEDTAFIGDTNVDMKTGINGGFFPIGVLWGFRDRQELETAGAAALAERAEDIFDIIFENGK